MKVVKNNWTYLLGALLGAVGGYLYWKHVGCSSGTCPITSSPVMSTLYGTLMGGLSGGVFKKRRN